MFTRVKELRKNLKLSQSEFGNRIGMTRDNIANIEGNRAEIKDVFIKSVCREYNVNEDWLRNGEGEMFNLPTDETASAISDLITESNPLYDRMVAFLKVYQTLDETSKKVINDFISDISKIV